MCRSLMELKKVYKIYKNNKKIVNALEEVNVTIKEGEFVTIVGKSGAGKSTFLNILGGLDRPTKGEYFFDGKLVKQDNISLSNFRTENVGIIVQNFALINYETVFYNISLPLRNQKLHAEKVREKVNEWALFLGIEDKLDNYPGQLSGGQCQRVAIARALCSKPKVLLADEPTGSLDYENQENVLEILKRLNQEGLTIILSTHDRTVAEQGNRKLVFDQGKLSCE